MNDCARKNTGFAVCVEDSRCDASIHLAWYCSRLSAPCMRLKTSVNDGRLRGHAGVPCGEEAGVGVSGDPFRLLSLIVLRLLAVLGVWTATWLECAMSRSFIRSRIEAAGVTAFGLTASSRSI
uniref:Uncharacterized protein n=1 Tax=Favella ehrenbergii TaxID=182087 RepID=A0A7S3HXX1_9SPIT|eukprot:scaffold136939_cov35-Tisochrysis_lutea.AAC.2